MGVRVFQVLVCFMHRICITKIDAFCVSEVIRVEIILIVVLRMDFALVGTQ